MSRWLPAVSPPVTIAQLRHLSGFDALAIEGRFLDLILVSLLGLLLYLAVTRWMLLDAVQRGRGWIRWQVLLHVATMLVAVPVWLVMRVIATGGDELQSVGGVVFRNGRESDEPYLTRRSHDDWGPEVVPEGAYFVMGDRRDNSSDSRHWGYVPREYVVGRVTLRWWPLSARRGF